MKLNSINGPSASSVFLFDLRIQLGPLEAPLLPKSPNQSIGGYTIKIPSLVRDTVFPRQGKEEA